MHPVREEGGSPMISIQTRTHIGTDGTLSVDVPTALRETDVEVMLVLQPVTGHGNGEPESRGWPPGFFEQTYGSFQNDPLERLPQGDFDSRDTIE
jgi:hypothetical protein